MQKLFSFFQAFLLGLALFTAAPGYAFAPDDQAHITFSLDPTWKLIPNVLSVAESNTILYQKIIPLPLPKVNPALKIDKKAPPPPSEQIETLSQRTEPKPLHTDTTQFIMQMGQILSQGLSTKGCETGIPTLVPQASDLFRVWVQVFQCAKSQLTGLQYYIDADPKNIYLITYTNTQYPFTLDSRNAAQNQIKSALKICYQNGSCYTLQ